MHGTAAFEVGTGACHPDRMKAALFAIAVVLAACTGGSGESETRRPARIAVLGTDGNVSTVDPATGEITAITTDAGPGRLYSQPTWSPDGSRLAFVASSAAVSAPAQEAHGGAARVALEAQQELAGAVHFVAASGGDPTVVATPFPPFYLYWSPDGSRLAFLGNDPSLLRIGLGMIDTVDGSVEQVDSGQPYYLAWSPASDRLLVHAAGRELYFLGLDGSKELAGPTPGRFSAPNWAGDTQLFPVAEDGKQILRLHDPDGTGRRDLVDYTTVIVMELNPDEERVAYIEVGPGANPFALGSLTVDTPGGVTEVAELAAAFFWSSDGSRLLYLTPDISEDEFALRWNVWDGSSSLPFERFLPTTTFVQQYLPFFGQYANSLSFFSPDGGSFTFAGTIDGRGEGIWVQEVADGVPAALVAPGEFSTWAP